ncbi:putative SP-containing protein [Vairimorpha necatrix]|uniref:SP-containing protein n=1 Tax=Vairimorpha necatrix TaxID=6039 RepID=A0AAX4JEE5_9MICR
MWIVFFHVVAKLCTDNIFVVPNYNNANVYISLKHSDLPGTYIITELINEDTVSGCVKTYNHRSKSVGQTIPHYFKSITSEETNSLEQFLNGHKICNTNDNEKVESFLKSDYVAVAKIPLFKNKIYFIDVMKSKNLSTVDIYSTSKKLTFNELSNFYTVELSARYYFMSDNVSSPIPSLYKNGLLRFSNCPNINNDLKNNNERLRYQKSGECTIHENQRINNNYLKSQEISETNIQKCKRIISDRTLLFATNFSKKIKKTFNF